MQTRVKTSAEIKAIRESGIIWGKVMAKVMAAVQPGVSTKALADIAAEELKEQGGSAPFLGYAGAPGFPNFPDVICISLNDEVVHGIPSKDRIIQDGDVVSLDFGVKWKGMITDGARTVIAGRPKTQGHIRLVQDTEAALQAGIAVLKDRVRAGDIGAAVEGALSHRQYGIVKDLVGHGVGHELHEDPNIPNYGRSGTGPWLSAGMTIAIEPMVNLGTERVIVAPDGWTILTADGSRSAHFEDTVLITNDGAEVITKL